MNGDRSNKKQNIYRIHSKKKNKEMQSDVEPTHYRIVFLEYAQKYAGSSTDQMLSKR